MSQRFGLSMGPGALLALCALCGIAEGAYSTVDCGSPLGQNSVEGAIAWAEDEAETSPTIDQCHAPSRSWILNCLHFVAHCYLRNSAGWEDPTHAWSSTLGFGPQHRGLGVDAPRGALVFFDWTGSVDGVTKNWGHIGIACGDGMMWHAYTSGVSHDSIAGVDASFRNSGKGNVLGWRWPNGGNEGAWTTDPEPTGATGRATGYGTGITILGALVTITANSTPQTLNSDANGYWCLPWFPSGTFVSGSINKSGYKRKAFELIIGSKSLQKGVVEYSLEPDSNAPTSTRFAQYDRVQVCNTGVGLRARSPHYDSAPVGVMADGQQGTVVGGPYPYNGYQWWQIRYDALSPTVAWSAEGEPATPGVYYLTKISVPTQPVLSVSPTSQSVGAGAGLAYFNVSNTGTGNMIWSATSNAGWLHIVSGTHTGINSGTIQCTCDANAGSSQRTGTIQVTATGASGSPKNVSVTQAGTAPPPPLRPNIVVTGGSRQGPEIAPGDSTPSTADGTDFGDTPVSMPNSHVIVIQNLYGDDGSVLQLTGSPTVAISGSSEFRISEQPPSTSLPTTYPENGTGFYVEFAPQTTGLKNAVVSILSNDTNHSPYQFAVQGTGALPTLSVNSGGVSVVPIVLSPPDASGQSSGTTPFSLH